MFKRTKTDFLFAQPSFLSGAARALDLAGTFDQYNESEDPDALAIAQDWQMIGDDLCDVIEREGVLQTIGIIHE